MKTQAKALNSHAEYMREYRRRRPFVPVNAELYWQLREKAARNRRTLSEEIDAAVKAWVES